MSVRLPPAQREHHPGRGTLPRHRHDRAYAAIVLDGGYEEAGSFGRFRVGPGDVIVHAAYDAHRDRFGERGAGLLNLTLPLEASWTIGDRVGRIADPDALVRLSLADPAAAAVHLASSLRPGAAGARDWPDILAADLMADPALLLEDWALGHGLAAATVSRGFRRIYGVAPAAYRLEVRSRAAWRHVMASAEPLAQVAALAGFADQAHMTRAIHVLTGAPPQAWRRVKSVQAGGRRHPVG